MTAAYGTEPKEARPFQASQRSGHARRFRAATRHSRRVRFLRVGLPVACVLAGLMIALASWLNPLRLLNSLPIKVAGVVVSRTKINMENPKLSGFTRDSRRYDVVAGAAAQDLTRPGFIELRDITATMEMREKSTTRLVAQEGLFDTKKEELKLERDIVVTSSNGQEAYLEEAVIDTKNGNVVSEKPVHMKMPNGTVKGNRFELTNSGDVIRFENGVVVNLKPDKGSKQPAVTQ